MITRCAYQVCRGCNTIQVCRGCNTIQVCRGCNTIQIGRVCNIIQIGRGCNTIQTSRTEQKESTATTKWRTTFKYDMRLLQVLWVEITNRATNRNGWRTSRLFLARIVNNCCEYKNPRLLTPRFLAIRLNLREIYSFICVQYYPQKLPCTCTQRGVNETARVFN